MSTVSLKNPNIKLHESTLLREEGDLQIYLIEYTRCAYSKRRNRVTPLSGRKEGIMVFCNGVYGIGKTIRGAKRNFMRKLGFK